MPEDPLHDLPFRFVPLHEILGGLREVVFPSRSMADDFDCRYPGLFSRYIARLAQLFWTLGELPLWAPTEGGGFEQVAWRSGCSIDWPDTNADVTITEYRAAALLSLLTEEPSLHRREGIDTSAAGAERLQAFVRAAMPETLPDTVIELWIVEQGAVSEKVLWERAQQQFGRFSPKLRPQLRPLHAKLKDTFPKTLSPRPPK